MNNFMFRYAHTIVWKLSNRLSSFHDFFSLDFMFIEGNLILLLFLFALVFYIQFLTEAEKKGKKIYANLIYFCSRHLQIL